MLFILSFRPYSSREDALSKTALTNKWTLRGYWDDHLHSIQEYCHGKQYCNTCNSNIYQRNKNTLSEG